MPDIVVHRATGSTREHISKTVARMNQLARAGHRTKLRLNLIVKLPAESASQSVQHSLIIECRTPEAIAYARNVLDRAVDSLNGVTLAVCAPNEPASELPAQAQSAA